jgi:hypothetical protein
MSREARRLAGFRPARETFREIRWDRSNRLWQETHKRTDPRISAACKFDWTRVVRRPDTRYIDDRQLGIVARDLGFQRVVYFLAYVKRRGFTYMSLESCMRTTMKSTLSSPTTLSSRALCIRRSAARQAPAAAVPVPRDADPQRALAWLERGKPQAEITYDDAVPAQSKTDLNKFRPASYRRSR